MGLSWVQILDRAQCIHCGAAKKRQSRREPRRALCTRCRHSLPPTLLFELEAAGDDATFRHYLDRALTFLIEAETSEKEARMDRRFGREQLNA
jgi:hypothetical protein